MSKEIKSYTSKFMKSGNLFHGYFNKISDQINKNKQDK